jgi:5,10-methylene-tetrahydrofolate dehydrogenase/methenyl tetrahydrofolate cyclohydrolase
MRAHCARADIVVAAMGRPLAVRADWIKPGAAVIDVGINFIGNGIHGNKLVGDVDYDSVAHVASHVSPVPGGVGPLTVAMLLQNTLRNFEQTLQV